MVLKNLISDIEKATKNALSTEPASIKRIVRGEIPTDAGIGNQYFSTLVFALTYTLTLGEHVLYHILDCVDNTEMQLKDLKELVVVFLDHGFKASTFLGYVLDEDIERYAVAILDQLESIENKEDLREVLGAYFSYINAMHWWLHVRFPWGLGVAFRKTS